MDGSHGRLVLHLNIRAASSCEGYGLHWNAASSTLVAVCVNVLRGFCFLRGRAAVSSSSFPLLAVTQRDPLLPAVSSAAASIKLSNEELLVSSSMSSRLCVELLSCHRMSSDAANAAIGVELTAGGRIASVAPATEPRRGGLSDPALSAVTSRHQSSRPCRVRRCRVESLHNL